MSKTSKAFDFAGRSGIYDGVITGTGLFGSLVSKIVWGMDQKKDLEYQSMATKSIPIDMDGRLLEVPVGTGVLTMPLYKCMKNACITCLDYSKEMMAHAESRAVRMGIKNIGFVRGDVAALPFSDDSFDVVLSMNGLHVFPDKNAAFSELFRVLKPGGLFCGCTYIMGESKKTDWFINKFYVTGGYFNPPFDTRESLRSRLNKMYSSVNVETLLSEACFSCIK